MTSNHITDLTIEETWASAFVDGEVSLSEQAAWSDTVHEQLYYYAVTRQVLRGELLCGRDMTFRTERTTLVQLWARVDAS